MTDKIPENLQELGPDWHLTAVTDPARESIVLWDIYFQDKWIGSRRTQEQCYEQLRHAGATFPDHWKVHKGGPW